MRAKNLYIFVVIEYLCRLVMLEEVKRSGTGGRQDPYIYTVFVLLTIFGAF